MKPPGTRLLQLSQRARKFPLQTSFPETVVVMVTLVEIAVPIWQ